LDGATTGSPSTLILLCWSRAIAGCIDRRHDAIRLRIRSSPVRPWQCPWTLCDERKLAIGYYPGWRHGQCLSCQQRIGLRRDTLFSPSAVARSHAAQAPSQSFRESIDATIALSRRARFHLDLW